MDTARINSDALNILHKYGFAPGLKIPHLPALVKCELIWRIESILYKKHIVKRPSCILDNQRRLKQYIHIHGLQELLLELTVATRMPIHKIEQLLDMWVNLDYNNYLFNFFNEKRKYILNFLFDEYDDENIIINIMTTEKVLPFNLLAVFNIGIEKYHPDIEYCMISLKEQIDVIVLPKSRLERLKAFVTRLTKSSVVIDNSDQWDYSYNLM